VVLLTYAFFLQQLTYALVTMVEANDPCHSRLLVAAKAEDPCARWLLGVELARGSAHRAAVAGAELARNVASAQCPTPTSA
jgi:hypothetical protein